MSDLALEIVTAEKEIAEIDLRLTQHEEALMRLRLDKMEGLFIPDTGQMVTSGASGVVQPNHAYFNVGVRVPSLTESQIDAEIARIEKAVRTLRNRKSELSSSKKSS